MQGWMDAQSCISSVQSMVKMKKILWFIHRESFELPHLKSKSFLRDLGV